MTYGKGVRPLPVRGNGPFRNLDKATPQQMWRRARWLLLLTLLIPGSAQLVAGSRRFARVILICTMAIWATGLLAGLIFLINRSWFLTIVATPFIDSALAGILVVAAIFYGIVTLDTLRLIKLGRLFGAARLVSVIASVALIASVSVAAGTASNFVTVQANLIRTVFNQDGFTAPVEGRYNILLLGGDAGSDRFGLRPDSISVLSIDANTGQTVNIGIPRNLQHVPFVEGSPMLTVYKNGWNCGVVCLINAIYKDVTDYHSDLYPDAEKNGSTAGVEATRDAVEAVTGLTIQSYVLVDMAGFEGLINALGGIDINVKDRLPVGGDEDINGQPINVRKWIEPGWQHLNGKYALWYARARHGSSDYSRMKRQRDVENAVVQQADPANLLSRFQKIANAGKKLVKTDIPAAMLGQYVDLALKAKALGITPLELVPPTIDVIHPNFSAIHEMIQTAIAPKAVTN